jgi:competence protein ComEA
MLKKILAVLAMLYAVAAFAAVDVNKATAAELDGIKGIGPGISTKILDERRKGSFKDWNDFIERVKGVGEGNAARFSAEGLTVNGATFKGVAAAKKEEKKDDKAAPAKTAASAPAAKEEKTDAKAQKDADKKAKAEAKAKKAEEAKARKEAAKQAKEDARKAKAEPAKPAAAASAAKPAASAKK